MCQHLRGLLWWCKTVNNPTNPLHILDSPCCQWILTLRLSHRLMSSNSIISKHWLLHHQVINIYSILLMVVLLAIPIYPLLASALAIASHPCNQMLLLFNSLHLLVNINNSLFRIYLLRQDWPPIISNNRILFHLCLRISTLLRSSINLLSMVKLLEQLISNSSSIYLTMELNSWATQARKIFRSNQIIFSKTQMLLSNRCLSTSLVNIKLRIWPIILQVFWCHSSMVDHSFLLFHNKCRKPMVFLILAQWDCLLPPRSLLISIIKLKLQVGSIHRWKLATSS